MDRVVITEKGVLAIRGATEEIRIVVTSLDIGTEFYAPSSSQETLRNKIDRLDLLELKDEGLGRLSFSAGLEIENVDRVEIGELGLVLENGDLFCVISNPDREITTYYENDTHVFTYALTFQNESLSRLIEPIEVVNLSNVGTLIEFTSSVVALAGEQLKTGLKIRDKQLEEIRGSGALDGTS